MKFNDFYLEKDLLKVAVGILFAIARYSSLFQIFKSKECEI